MRSGLKEKRSISVEQKIDLNIYLNRVRWPTSASTCRSFACSRHPTRGCPTSRGFRDVGKDAVRSSRAKRKGTSSLVPYEVVNICALAPEVGDVARAAESSPQWLKPIVIRGLFGTTESRTLPKILLGPLLLTPQPPPRPRLHPLPALLVSGMRGRACVRGGRRYSRDRGGEPLRG